MKVTLMEMCEYTATKAACGILTDALADLFGLIESQDLVDYDEELDIPWIRD